MLIYFDTSTENEIPVTFEELKPHLSQDAKEVIHYFENN